MKAEGCCRANPESKLKSCPCPGPFRGSRLRGYNCSFYPCSWVERGDEPTKQTSIWTRVPITIMSASGGPQAGGLYARGRTKTTSWLRKVVAGSDSVIDAKGFSKMEICGEGATGAIITGADKVGTVEISSADITGNCCARDRVTVGSDGLPLSALCQWHPVRAWPEHL